MQFLKPGYPTSYGDAGDVKSWYQALNDPGFSQMKYLKNLILSFPFFVRVPDQSIIEDNGQQYNRLIATRGDDYLMVYNYTSRDMRVDLRKISGDKKNVWWMNARDGSLQYLGEYDSKVLTFRPNKGITGIDDGVLIAVDSTKDYLSKEQTEISDQTLAGKARDLNE
jgi:hypothetical protein